MIAGSLNPPIQIAALMKKVAIGIFAVRFFRAIAPSAIIILSLGAFAPLFSGLSQLSLDATAQTKGIISFFVSTFVWLVALILLVARLLKLQKPSRARVLARTDEILSQAGLPQTNVIENKKAFGDDGLWQLLRSKSDTRQLAGLNTMPRIEFQDWFYLFGLLTTASFCALSPSQSAKSIGINVSALTGDYALEAIAWATPPAYIGGSNIDISTYSGQIELARGSTIEVRAYGPIEAPILKIGNYHEKMRKIGDRRYRQLITINKTGDLKIFRPGNSKTWRIRVLRDSPPKIGRSFRIEKTQNGAIALGFKAKDDHKITKAALVLEGASWFPFLDLVQKPFQSIYPIDAGLISPDEVSNFEIDVSDSVLAGFRANAFLVLEDSAGQRAFSKTVPIKIDSPPLGTVLAQAIQELRLKLLRSRQSYRHLPASSKQFFDQISNNVILIGAPAQGAPNEVKLVYHAISALLIAPEQMGIDEGGRLGLIFAQAQLARARNMIDAKMAGDILWELVLRSNQVQPQDTKSRIAQAISNLKQGLQNGAGEAEISELRSELNQAVAEHIEELKSRSQEAGDMEVEGHDTLNSESIEEAIDAAQSAASAGDLDAANQKLDALQRQLENLSGVEPSEGVGQSGELGEGQELSSAQVDELLQDQRRLNDDTFKQADTSGALSVRQKAILEKLRQVIGQNSNPNLNEADAAMRDAVTKLETGQRGDALNAQNRALTALQNYAGALSQNDSRDPLGRQGRAAGDQTKAATGQDGANEEEKIPANHEQARARNIFERLRQRLEKSQKDDEQRHYLEELLRRQ